MPKIHSPLKPTDIRQRLLKITKVNCRNRQILGKLDQTIISPKKLKELINSFPGEDREIVAKIIKRSTHANVGNLLADLRSGFEHLKLDNEILMSLGSAGHALMYLIRKNNMRNSNYFCNYVGLKQVKPDKIFF